MSIDGQILFAHENKVGGATQRRSMVSEFQIGTRDRAGAFPVFLISKLGTPTPGAGLTLEEITIDAAIAKQMSLPPFPDQIDHAARLAEALRAIKAAPWGN